MRQPIQNYYLAGIEVFQTPPAGSVFDPAKPQKYWRDPAAAKSPFRSMVYDVVAYRETGGVVVDDQGRPMMDKLVLPKETAGALNIPPPDATWPTPLIEPLPTPIRPLLPTEQLVMGWGGIVYVDDGAVDESKVGSGLTQQEHDTLLLILAILLDMNPKTPSITAATAGGSVNLFTILQYIGLIMPIFSVVLQLRDLPNATESEVRKAFADAADVVATAYLLARSRQ